MSQKLIIKNQLKCPERFDWKFGKKLIKYLDPSVDISMIDNFWCWREFIREFKYLQSAVEKYLMNATTGEPTYALFMLLYNDYINEFKLQNKLSDDCNGVDNIWDCNYCNINAQEFNEYLIQFEFKRKKIETFIKNCKIGNPTNIVVKMVKHCNSSVEWAQDVIENCKIGDPVISAVNLAILCKCSNLYEWAENIITGSKIGNTSRAAYLMTIYCYSSEKWASEIILNSKNKNKLQDAYNLYYTKYKSNKWAKKFIAMFKYEYPDEYQRIMNNRNICFYKRWINHINKNNHFKLKE